VGSHRRSAALPAATLAIALIFAHALGEQRDRPATRARMQAIFNSLSTALDMTIYDTPFEGGENRAMIMDALGVLTDNAAALETHGEELNESFDHLRRSLARDANEAVIRFRQEQYEGACFLLDQLIESCVARHSKLPTSRGFDVGRAFVERARVEELPAAQRAAVGRHAPVRPCARVVRQARRPDRKPQEPRGGLDSRDRRRRRHERVGYRRRPLVPVLDFPPQSRSATLTNSINRLI
jgi:hypothetical protein